MVSGAPCGWPLTGFSIFRRGASEVKIQCLDKDDKAVSKLANSVKPLEGDHRTIQHGVGSRK